MKSQEEQWLLKEKYNSEKSEVFFADCKQLALGEPLAYLIGTTPFLDTTIHLDGRPLIPRVETEFWVEKAITAIKESQTNQPSLDGSSKQTQVLDLCAGSGCIGVAVAKHVTEAIVDFGEIDARLLDTIKKNCEENNIDTTRYTIFHSNLFVTIPPDKKYDFILSNPPYIDASLNRADENVKVFEPHIALFGGKDGMDVIAQLINSAADHLAPNGQIWIEHEPEQVGALAQLAKENNFAITSLPDQYDVLRYSVLVVQ